MWENFTFGFAVCILSRGNVKMSTTVPSGSLFGRSRLLVVGFNNFTYDKLFDIPFPANNGSVSMQEPKRR